MPKLIDISYFYGDLAIPQKTTDSVRLLLEEYINKYEFKYLCGVMGYELAKMFYASLPDAAGVYDPLLLGGEYYLANRLTKWDGLKVEVVAPQFSGNPPVQSAPGRYRSPIANYIYYHFTKDNMTQSTGTGEKVLEAQNAIDAHPVTKLIQSWNEMVQQNLGLIRFIEDNALNYPTFTRYDVERDLITIKNPLGI